MELARRTLGHLRRGLEIGASVIAPFPGVRAWNLDHPAAQLFQEAQRRMSGAAVPIHVFATAERLPLRSGALEFLLASHVIEHMPDTMRALVEWDRVLAPGGVAFLIVPHRDRTIDSDRPITPLAHHLADHALGASEAADALVPTSHYHVWRTADFLALLEHLVGVGELDWTIEAVEDVDSRAGNGFTVVARKRGPARPRAAKDGGDARVAFHQLTLALPFQVARRWLHTIVPGERLPAYPSVPRGLYRVAAISGGHPPRLVRAFELEVGPSVPAPVLARARWEGVRCYLAGEHLSESTWLEGTYPGGAVHRVLPGHELGELYVDFRGLPLPPGAFQVVAVNLPPGGGRSAPLVVSPP